MVGVMGKRLSYSLSCFVFALVALLQAVSCDLFAPTEVFPTAVHIQSDSGFVILLDNKSVRLTAVFTPQDVTNKSVTWRCYNEDILNYDSATGKLLPVKPGVARITVTSKVDETISDTATFYVVDSIADEGMFDYDSIDVEKKTISVKRINDKNRAVPAKEIKIPQEVYLNDDVYTVVSISDNAFDGMSSLENVVIPDSVTSIGARAFKNCGNLNKIDFPDGLKSIGESCFENCDRLFSITIPKNLASIGDGAFSGCVRLVEVYDLSTALQTRVEAGSDSNGMIGKHALVVHTDSQDESKLKHYDNLEYFMKDENDWMVIGAVSDTVDVLGTVRGECTSVNDYAFYGMPYLKSVNFGSMDNAPRKITKIGKYAFANCENLKNVLFSETLNEIDDCAFLGCSKLDSFSVVANVGRIGDNAFKDCIAMDVLSIRDYSGSAAIPAADHVGVEYGSDILKGCINLNTIELTSLAGKTLGYFFSNEEYGASNKRYQVVQSEDETAVYYIPKTIKVVELTKEGSIPAMAFAGCNTLTSIRMNDGIDTIGNKAFYGCSSIMTEISIPSTVVSFGTEAFEGIPSTVLIRYDNSSNPANNSLNNPLFKLVNGELTIFNASSAVWESRGMNQLVKQIRFDTQIAGSVVSIPENSFKGCVGIANGVDLSNLTNLKTVGASAFSGCGGLTSISFPEGLESIGPEAFAFCSSLTALSLPASVTSVGLGAFGGCVKLAQVELPFTGSSSDASGPASCFGYIFGTDAEKFSIPGSSGGVNGTTATDQSPDADSAEGWVFYIPNSLTRATINSVANGDGEFGAIVFRNCRKLSNITLNIRDLVELPDYAFKDCTGITTISISANDGAAVPTNTLKTIGDHSFDGCTGLTALSASNILLDSVENIGEGAFNRCTSLSSISFPAGIESVGPEAFAFCSSLTAISLPASVTSVGLGAFGGCVKLAQVELPFTGSSSDASGPASCFGYIFGTDAEKFSIPGSSGGVNGTTATDQSPDADSAEGWVFYIPNSLLAEPNSQLPAADTVIVRGAADEYGNLSSIMFRGCEKIARIALNVKNLKTLPAEAFKNCIGLIRIEVTANDAGNDPVDTLWNIGQSAFEGCSSMETVLLPHSIRNIEACAFKGCEKMLSRKNGNGFLLKSPIKSIGVSAFEDCAMLEFVDLWQCSDATGQNLSEVVSDLPDRAFYNCIRANVVIPRSLTSISDTAFGVSEDSDRGKTAVLMPNGYSYDFYDVDHGDYYDASTAPLWASQSGCRLHRWVGINTTDLDSVTYSRWNYSNNGEISVTKGYDPGNPKPAQS